MSEQFSEFLSQLSETNATLGYFTDFGKVRSNVNKIAIKLNQLNYLIGKDNLKEAIAEVYSENPKSFEVLDILIAVRKNKKAMTLNKKREVVSINSYFESPHLIYEFIVETGLASIFKNNDITNLVDYVFGIEVGLDTNARKNRGGDNMAKAVSSAFDSAGVLYKAEVNSIEFPEIISLGVDVKRFDFVIKTNERTYLIETNYYNTGGSKPNETARAYSDLGPKINQYDNFEFVWITDGKGWLTAKNKLEEAFNTIPLTYNLKTLPLFIDKVINEGVLTL